MLKPIPPATIEHVLPPNLAHDYFRDGAAHRFQPRAEGFSSVNAWWLAEASLLTYADPEFAAAQFAAAGWTLDADRIFEGRSTRCYIACSDDAAIVAFRGTRVIKPGGPPPTLAAIRGVLADIWNDGGIHLIDAGYGGPVHRGFHGGLEEVWPALSRRIAELQAPPASRAIWLTGHSLGAALATLASCRLGRVQGLYTFGSPLVGDEAFAGRFATSAFRVVNHNDVVSRVPSMGPYRGWPPARRYEHVGQLKYIASDGVLQQDDPSRWALLREEFSGRFGHLLQAWQRLPDGIVELPDDGFNDHAPLYYALHMWNAYARQRVV